MRATLFVLAIFLFANTMTFAEGTKQLAPNAKITITGVDTNDIAALYLDNPRFGSFASYNNANPLSRLHINIQDPANECIYLGFSRGELNGLGTVRFEYRILDPNGNVVYGPITVEPAGANIQRWQQGFDGPSNLAGATGYNPWSVTSADLTSAGWMGEGDYYIEFNNLDGTDFIINYWDITVVNCSGAAPVEKLGRVWSNNWSLFAINDLGFPNRPFNGSFFVCAPDPSNPNASFITQVDFNNSGFRPGGFNVAFNSYGVQNTGNIVEDRKSVELVNAALPEYAIFLNDPVDICETGELGEIDLIGLSRCSIDDFCIKFITSKEGQLDLLLDFDGPDGVYTPGTADVLITHIVGSNGINKATCLDWNGKDGLGNPVVEDASTEIPLVLSYAQGIYHFPIYDAELLTDGLNLSSVRPAGPKPLLYYDDSQISTASGTPEPKVQIAGCNLPCHRWTTYIEANTMGYGNLNTINSWWFSQQLLTEATFLLPGYYTCTTYGDSALCPGDTGTIYVETTIQPLGAEALTFISKKWSGPSIVGSSNGDAINVTEPGNYHVDVSWITSTGDTCSTSCQYDVEKGRETTITVDTLILKGDTVDINGEMYTETGQYIQIITSQESCDTLLIINVVAQQTILHYDLNDCLAVISKETHKDYSEFEVDYPNPLSCADLTANYLRRENPDTNTHSCTPGVNGTPAMCVSSYDSCLYDPGNQKSVIIELTVEPEPDTAVAITSFTFYEKGPEMFDWIAGDSGINNYPTMYGFRVLKDGTEIYREEDVPTSRTWSFQVYSFGGISDFTTDVTATYRFELLGYCRVGDTSKVSAWDLDELSINAACVSPNNISPIVSGKVITRQGVDFPGADLFIADHPSFDTQAWVTSNEEGFYAFNSLLRNTSYMLRSSSDHDIINGITTKDLILIMRHLLGQKEFTSPLDLIAADVNNSRSVSMSDIAQLRKLVLGKIDKFDNNTSWRMGDYYEEWDMVNPWDFGQPIKVLVEDQDLNDQHLLAIKVGDVSGDASINGIKSTQTRSKEHFDIRLNSVSDKMEFIADQNTNLSGLQLAISLSNTELKSVLPGILDLHQENIHWKDNTLYISYNVGESLLIQPGDILFSLGFEDIDKAQIELTKSRLNAEIYDDELNSLNIILNQEKKTTGLKSSISIAPNPFKQSTTISFDVNETCQVDMDFYSLQGQHLLNTSSVMAAGTQSIEVHKEDIGITYGVVLVKLKIGDNVSTRQLIIYD